MSDNSTDEIAKTLPNVPRNDSQFPELSTNHHLKISDELSTVRSLLLGVEPNQLNKLYERLDNPQIQPEDISRLLPEAISLRAKQDEQLGEAMVSTVETAIQNSVKQDQDVLSEAFFPIIGSATRKAIATVLDEMIQSLNQTLEHSLSPQSLQWRLEARQTGKSFAEIVLLRTLVYRVEQVFLIHQKTGLLLQHLVANQVKTQDPDLVSAMLTAIQDFVKDSFSVQKDDGLQSLQFGELTIWIEAGPQAVLAAIISGNPPQEFRLVLQDAIAKIHLRLGREISDFTGETEPFEASKPYLAACLAARYKSSAKKNYTYAWSFLGIIAIAFGIWSFFALRQQLRFSSYLQKLDSQPGIVVINTKQHNGKYIISGMRDPLAIDPQTLLKQANLNPQTVISQWESYLSLEPQFIATRAKEFLQTPKTVSLQVDHNGILNATGVAPRQWVLATRKSWHFIPGVTQFNDQNLQELEFIQLKAYQQQIEQELLFFLEGKTELIAGEADKLTNLVVVINKLVDIAKYLNQDVRIQITGHTNTSGTEQRNILLSQSRANTIRSYLISQGINASKFNAVGVSSSLPLQPELTQKAKMANRRVSFQIFLVDHPN
ncbi:OmpA family protein [Calothrix sp. PCC 7507]|uniref:OmpA family protein n=1 Tax=Calothrix sp. PCC 7507 TaxID=99598 RepID=UPI00029EDB2F|nr:OmpA family protein [Calothrix sp. PCC 7507]AFY33131.1 OmpA/MotB domain protein [Calothrix sp. PCC 7507]